MIIYNNQWIPVMLKKSSNLVIAFKYAAVLKSTFFVNAVWITYSVAELMIYSKPE